MSVLSDLEALRGQYVYLERATRPTLVEGVLAYDDETGECSLTDEAGQEVADFSAGDIEGIQANTIYLARGDAMDEAIRRADENDWPHYLR